MIPIAALCLYYNLGEPLGDLKKIRGGFLHQIWQIATTTGQYCIKKLNLNPTPENLQHIQQYHAITQAFQAKGVYALPANTINNQAYCQINEDVYLVFPWIQGHVLTPATTTSYYANKMAQVLAQLHTANITAEITHAAAWDLKPLAWQALGATAPQIAARLPQILNWQQLYDEHRDAFTENLIISHRDLYSQNVIWQEARAVIIDWEGAGWIHPQIEIFNLAINWSGFVSGNFDQAIFENIISTYQAAANTHFALRAPVIYASFGSWLGWLQYNILRLVQDQPAIQTVALNEIHSCLRNLARLDQLAARN